MTQRVELHLHTTVSGAVSVITPRNMIRAAKEKGLKAVAITDRNSVQAFHAARYWREHYGNELKIIYGAELFDAGNKVTVLAKDRAGLKALYRLISGKDITPEERKHLLMGTGNFDPKTEEPEKYDYFELLPTGDRERSKDIYALGKRLGIPVVAVSDCRGITPEEYDCARVVETCREPAADTEGTYLRTAEEMLQSYAYLGEEAAREVVLTNPERIADSIPQLDPEERSLPTFALPEAFETVTRLCEEKLEQLYGPQMPEAFRRRLQEELTQARPYATHYLLSHKIVKHLHEMGAITGTRGTVGSTLMAYLLGISDTNPLPAHYRCKACKHVEPAEADSGYDLPKKTCPHCGGPMQGDGHDLPYETCMAVDGDLAPDIDINVPKLHRNEAMDHVVQLLGRERVAYAGTVNTLMDRLAEAYVRVYEDLQGEDFSRGMIEWMTYKLSEVKKGEGRHPGGIVLLPEGMEWEDVTPVREPEQLEMCAIDKVTHMDFYWVEYALLKLDLLGYGVLDRLERLCMITGVKPEQVDYQDPAVYELFRRGDTCGLPEFSDPFCKEVMGQLEELRFSDLVRVSGMSHGTEVWRNNGENLIREHPFRELIGARDDIFKTLRRYGVDKNSAYGVMTSVRKGRFADQWERWQAPLKQVGVPDWYIASMKKIRYLFPKAHAVGYTKLAVAAAWFKHYYPTEFYNVTLRDLGAEVFLQEDQDYLQQRLEKMDSRTEREAFLLLREARERRIPLDLQK